MLAEARPVRSGKLGTIGFGYFLDQTRAGPSDNFFVFYSFVLLFFYSYSNPKPFQLLLRLHTLRGGSSGNIFLKPADRCGSTGDYGVMGYEEANGGN